MKYIEITTSIGCRNSCVYCPQEKLVRRYAQRCQKPIVVMMQYQLFKKVVDKIPPDVVIDFAGMSEPFLNPECVNMIKYACLKGHKVFLYTTLMGINRKQLKKLLDEVPLGRNGNDVVLHLPSNDGEENFVVDDEYVGTLQLLLNSGVKIKDLHYHGHTLHRRVADLLIKTGYRATYCQPMPRAGNVEVVGVGVPQKKCGKLNCVGFKNKGFILLPDGTTVMCCMDYGLDYVMGNLGKNNYNSILHNKTYRQVKKKQNTNFDDVICRYCHYSYGVNGLAVYGEMGWSFSKILLGSKLIIYNYIQPLYRFLRLVKNVVFRPKKIPRVNTFLKI